MMHFSAFQTTNHHSVLLNFGYDYFFFLFLAFTTFDAITYVLTFCYVPEVELKQPILKGVLVLSRIYLLFLIDLCRFMMLCIIGARKISEKAHIPLCEQSLGRVSAGLGER